MKLPNSIASPRCFNPFTGRTETASDHESIRQSLILLFQTSPGELLGDPDYGTHLKKILFEPNIPAVHEDAKSHMVSAAMAYEPRITMTTQDILIYAQDNEMIVRISYKIKNSDTRDTIILKLS